MAKQATQGINQDASTPGDDSTSIQGPSTPSTPHPQRQKRTRPTLHSLTPRSKSRAAKACKLFRVKFATTNPFPFSADAYDIAWKSYAEAHIVQDEEDMEEVDHLLCKMQKDPVFAKENLAMVCNLIIIRSVLIQLQVMRGTSQLRGELKDKARTAIVSHYITPMGSDRRVRKQTISWLLKCNIFIFGSLEVEVCATIISSHPQYILIPLMSTT